MKNPNNKNTVLENVTNSIKRRKQYYKNDICEVSYNDFKVAKKRLIWLSNQGYLLNTRSIFKV